MSLLERIIEKIAIIFNWSPETPSTDPMEPEQVPIEPVAVSVPPQAPVLDWQTQKGAYHAVRVTCDNLDLSLGAKNLICACIFQESRFLNSAKNENKNEAGQIMSTDWGICQVNDWYHIGPGKDFASVEYVLANPDKVVEWMISMYQHGQLKQWVSYSSGAYEQWLAPNSPMWTLAS